MAEEFENILIYEDEAARGRCFLPLTYTRSLAELRSGAYTGIERAQRLFRGRSIFLHCAPHLAEVVRERYGLPVNEIPQSGATLLVNARDLFGTIDESQIVESVVSGLASAVTSGAPLPAGLVPESSGPAALWQIIHANPKRIEEDAKLLRSGGFPRIDASQLKHSAVEKPENLYLHRHARIGAMTVFDCTAGPIIVDEGAEIMPMTTIIGPVFIGKRSLIKVGSKIYGGTSIGPVSKIGGEVENSIVQSHSNKQHDGYLGHSYLGEWVNLGAGTNTSDLRNDYGSVSVTIEGEEFDTGSMFVGLSMGDHSKCAIGTQFNTGTVVGVSCNIFSAGFPPRWIKSFSWGGAKTILPYRFDKAIAVATRVVERRQKQMTPAEAGVLKALSGE